MTARATAPPPRQALLGLLALLLLPVAGEALAQTTPAATTTIELEINPKYIPEGTGNTVNPVIGAESTITVTARYVITPPSISGPGNPAPATATDVTINVAPGGFAADTAYPVATGPAFIDGFTAVGPVTINIPAGSTSATGVFTITAFNASPDTRFPAGGASLAVSGTATGFSIDSVPLIIIDAANPAEYYDLSLSTSSVAEDSGTTNIIVTASLPSGATAAASERTITVSVAGGTTNGATGGGTDFDDIMDFPLTIPASGTSGTATFDLVVNDDGDIEGSETVIIAGTGTPASPRNIYNYAIRPTTLTITDNDVAADTISVSLDTESVAEDSGTTTLMVTAEAAASGMLATTATITFELVTTGDDAGTATSGAADADPPGDFTLSANSVDLVFAVNDTSMTGNLVLTVHPDEEPEGDETLVFTATTTAINPATGLPFEIPNVTLTIDGQLTAEEIEEIEEMEEIDDRIESMAPELARTSVSTVVNAVSNRIGNIATGFAQTEFVNSLAETLASNERGLNDGTLSLAETLAGSELSLGAGQADPDEALGIWVSADYERMSSKFGLEDWDGSQISLHAGVDRHITKSALVGMAVFWSEGNAEFDSDSDLETDTRLLGVNPYFGWHSEDGTHTAWGTFGYSGGDLEQKQLDIKTDLSMAMLAVGGSRTFEPHSGVDLSLKGDLSTATISADSVDSTGSMTSKVHRARLAMEASNSSVDILNRSVKRSASLGVRRDSGDGDTGYGAELEAAVRWTDPQRGLTLAGNVRLLPLHSGDLKEWGIGGLVRYQPAHGRGLNVQLQPSYRPARSDSGSLWETEISDLDPAGEPEAHLVMDTGYGIAALSGQALVTPYSEASLSEGGDRNYRLGTRIGTGGGFHVDLAGSRRESGNGEPEHGIGVNLDLRW